MERNFGSDKTIKRHSRRSSSNDSYARTTSSFDSPKNKNRKKHVRKFSEELPQSTTLSGPVYLQNEWAFWYDANTARGLKKEEYENSIVKFGSFNTIQVCYFLSPSI